MNSFFLESLEECFILKEKMIRAESHAIINEDMELLKEAANGWVEKAKSFIKNVITKTKEYLKKIKAFIKEKYNKLKNSIKGQIDGNTKITLNVTTFTGYLDQKLFTYMSKLLSNCADVVISMTPENLSSEKLSLDGIMKDKLHYSQKEHRKLIGDAGTIKETLTVNEIKSLVDDANKALEFLDKTIDLIIDKLNATVNKIEGFLEKSEDEPKYANIPHNLNAYSAAVMAVVNRVTKTFNGISSLYETLMSHAKKGK